MTSRAVLVTGGGGVGKTTLSAAFGVAAAERGLRTLVVTVDPAKRLADALGVDSLGSEPTPNRAIDGLWAAMLDSESSWNAIVERHAAPDAAERLLENEFFGAISRQFPASQAYAAAEEMANFLDAKVWDLVVVDTPPSSGGIGFFTAPTDIKDLVGGRLLRWLTGSRIPGRTAMYNLTGRPALRIAGSVLGSDLFERIADFLVDLRTTYDGLARRSKEIERHFKRAGLIVVTTADPSPVREAARFFRELPSSAPTPSHVIFNRTLPATWQASELLVAAQLTSAQLRTLDRNLERWSAESQRQSEARFAFADRYRAEIATVDWQPTAPTDVAALANLVNEATNLDLDRILKTV